MATFDAHSNFAVSTVATAPSPATSGTSLTVTTGDGVLFPTPPFNATLAPASTQPTKANSEIVRVTAISTDTLTITRAQESSTAQSVANGWQIFAGPTAKTLTDIETAVNAAGAVTIFECKVGTGGDYSTLSAAITAGKKKILLISSITETGNITLVDGLYVEGLSQSYVIDFSTYNLTSTSSHTYTFRNLTITSSTSTAALISDNTYTIYMQNVIFNDNNAGGGTNGLRLSTANGYFENCTFNNNTLNTSISFQAGTTTTKGIFVRNCIYNNLQANSPSMYCVSNDTTKCKVFIDGLIANGTTSGNLLDIGCHATNITANCTTAGANAINLLDSSGGVYYTTLTNFTANGVGGKVRLQSTASKISTGSCKYLSVAGSDCKASNIYVENTLTFELAGTQNFDISNSYIVSGLVFSSTSSGNHNFTNIRFGGNTTVDGTKNNLTNINMSGGYILTLAGTKINVTNLQDGGFTVNGADCLINGGYITANSTVSGTRCRITNITTPSTATFTNNSASLSLSNSYLLGNATLNSGGRFTGNNFQGSLTIQSASGLVFEGNETNGGTFASNLTDSVVSNNVFDSAITDNTNGSTIFMGNKYFGSTASIAIERIIARMRNVTGVAVAAGDIMSQTYASSALTDVTRSTTASDPYYLGVALATVNNNNYGNFIKRGQVPALKVDGSGTAIAAGDYLKTSTTAGVAVKATTGDTAIAIAAAAATTATTIAAILIDPVKI